MQAESLGPCQRTCMGKPKTRFRTEDAIIKAINAAHGRQEKYLTMAEAHDEEARACIEEARWASGARPLVVLQQRVEVQRAQAALRRRSALRCERRARTLGKVLAAFRTQTMEFLPDTSLPKPK